MKNTVVCSIALAFATAAHAADYTWTGAVSASMNNPANYADEFGLPAAALPTSADSVLFSIPVGEVANLPSNEVFRAEVGLFHFMTSGYVVAGDEIMSAGVVIDKDVSATSLVTMSWSVSPHQIIGKAGSKFVIGGYFGGSRNNDFLVRLDDYAELVFMKDAVNAAFDNSSQVEYTISLGTTNRLDFFMRLPGVARIRTTGGPAFIGPQNKIEWQWFGPGDLRFGGPGSGDITQSSLLGANWGDGRTLFVDDIVYRVESLWSDEGRAIGTGTFNKGGNGTLVITGLSGLSEGKHQGWAPDGMNGLDFRILEGAACFNAEFLNYSCTQPSVEGLNVAVGARMEGVGTFNTRNPYGDGSTNKFARIHGTIAPGCSHIDGSASFGALSYIGTNFVFCAGSTFEVETSGDAHDMLALDAQPVVIEDGAMLEVRHLSAAAAPAFEPFVILDNLGDAPISGVFDGLPEGKGFAAAVDSGPIKRFKISYIGGDGNDVALTPLPDTTLMLVR